MSYKIIRDANNRHQTGREIVAILDTDEDLAALGNAYAPGSQAIVTQQGGNTYMMNASGEWVKFDDGGSSSSGGSGLPAGSKPNQYIVTDGEGNAKWEDKLCWNGKEVVIEEQTFTTTDQEIFLATVEGVGHKFELGEECVVTWDGVEHKCVCKSDERFEDVDVVRLGNNDRFDESDEPFCIVLYYIPVGNGFTNVEIVAEDGISHTVGIATETIHPIDKKYLPSGILYADENRVLFHDSNFANPVLYEEGKIAGNIIICYEEPENGGVVYFYPIFKNIVEKVNAVEFQCIDYDDNANPGFKTFYVGVAAG